MKAVILEEQTVSGNGEISFDGIRKLCDTVSYPLTPQDKVVERVGDAEAVLINKTLFTREVMEQCPNLRYIGLLATGYNNVDVKAAAELGITVCNSPAYSTDAVAQHVFAFILAFSDKVCNYSEDVRSGGWIRSETFSYFTFPTYELAGMTLGIIGYGRIGRRVSEIARAFGMNVIVSTRTPIDSADVRFVSCDDVFRESDFITLHCPLTEQTAELVCSRTLDLCKKSAVIINTSRGGTVNEQDLADALKAGRIAGAAVDVISVEPMLESNPLYTVPNCLITPHTAWAPVQTRMRLMKTAERNLKAFIEGNPVNKVN